MILPQSNAGKNEKVISFEIVRDLLESDVEVRTSSLQRMRDSHHALARVLAGGIREADASRLTGFAISTIKTLQSSPDFQELLAFYRLEDKAERADLRARLSDLALDVSQEIQDRLHNDPGSFSVSELRQFLTALADRTGHGPSSTVHAQVDVIEHLSYAEQRTLADALESLSREASRPLIEGTSLAPTEAALEPLPERGTAET